MSLLSRLAAVWRLLRHRTAVERELDAELNAFVELLTEEKRRAGLAPAEARRAALLELGGAEVVKEEVRAVRTGAIVETLWQDLRFAARSFRASPGFTITAVLTLGLGIGANSALFSLTQSMLLRARPGIAEAERLVWVAHLDRSADVGTGATPMSYGDFIEYRRDTGVFTDVAAVSDQRFAITAGDEAERVQGQFVSSNYFAVLGVPFALGRPFMPEEDVVGDPRPVVVISHGQWQRRFAGDSAVLGRTVRVNGVPLTVVGVAAAGFDGVDVHEQRRSVWVPTALYPILAPTRTGVLTSGNHRVFHLVGRLEPGVTREQADAAVAATAARLARGDSARLGLTTARTYSAATAATPGSARNGTRYVAFAVTVTGLVLLIACANVGNLLLGRGVARRRELGIRLALGAGRGRVVRQLLTESLLLALVAGVLGLLLARISLRLLLAVAVPIPLDVSLDWRALAVTLVVAAGTAFIAGLAPALDATRVDLVTVYKSGPLMGGPARARLQEALVVVQVALSLLLLVTSGVFLRSLEKATRAEMGFEASPRVLAASVDLAVLNYSREQASALLDEALARATALPGVRSASAADVLAPRERLRTVVATAGGAAPTVIPDLEGAGSATVALGIHEADALQTIVRPGYFRTMGIELVAGRDFNASDTEGAPATAIVSEALAARHWPDGTALGATLRLHGSGGPLVTVVGVARDVRAAGPGAPAEPMVYLPQLQYAGGTAARFTLLLRADADARPLAAMLRRELRALDPDLPVHQVRTLEQLRDESLAPQRHASTVLAIFGALALLLATLGVYAVMAFTAGQRMREIAVRVALGSQRHEVVRLIVRRGLRLTLAGVAIGLALAAGATRIIAALWRFIEPTDPVTFAAVTAPLAGVTLLACWIPARRAAQIDPMMVLRNE